MPYQSIVSDPTTVPNPTQGTGYRSIVPRLPNPHYVAAKQNESDQLKTALQSKPSLLSRFKNDTGAVSKAVGGFAKNLGVSTARSALQSETAGANLIVNHPKIVAGVPGLALVGAGVKLLENKAGYKPTANITQKTIAKAGKPGKAMASFIGTPNKHQTVGAIIQTAALGLPGLGSVGEKVGAKLLPNLAEKVTTKIASKGAGAAATKATVKGAEQIPTGAAFGAGQGIQEGQKPGQIFKNAAEGAAVTAGLGAVGSVAGGAVKGIINASKDARQTVNSSLDAPKTEKANVAQSTTTPTVSKMTTDAQSAPEVKAIADKRAKPGEEGFVDPGQAVKDIQDLVAKYSEPTKYSRDVQTAGHQVEGVKSQIQSDALKAVKGTPSFTPEEKRAIQDYRDAKEAGLPTPKLSDKLQQTNDLITTLNQATNKALDERDKFNGVEPGNHPNPESYVHREVQGKGGRLEQVSEGKRNTVQGATGFGKTIGAEKKRIFQAITDSNGQRQVVAVKNESFGRIKHVFQFDGDQNMTKLGKFDYDAKSGNITSKKKGSYQLGQATVNEIEKATGKKYIVDPLTTTLKNYVDARTAAENLKFIEGLKKNPDFAKFSAAPNTTAPKGWETVPGFLQFSGYKFEPKVAESLRDIAKGIGSFDEPRFMDRVGGFLRRAIVYFPLKHDLNMTAANAVDRGLTSLANPMAYKRGVTSLVQAFDDLTNQSKFFQDLQREGFNLVSSDADREKLTRYFQGELKNVLGNEDTVADIAKQWGSSPARIYRAIQQLSVWEVQDLLNVARVRERMMPTLFSKGMSFEDAMKATQKYSFQYRVPSRVGGKLLPGKVGRAASRTLQSRIVFFGPYSYDKYKILSNIIKDTVNLKTLVKNPRQNLQAADRLAALAVGATIAWPLVDKGIQKVTGNHNAYSTAPGPLGPVETAIKVAKGQKTPEQAATSQVSINPLATSGTALYSNTDPFTGKPIADPNASLGQRQIQRAKYLLGQFAPAQKVAGGKNSSGNKILGIGLSIAGATLPKNNPETVKLNSLKYDTLPNIQSNAKSLVQQGNYQQAVDSIKAYNQQVLKSAKAALKASGKQVPDDTTLQTDLEKAGYFYNPEQKTVKGWVGQSKQGTLDTILNPKSTTTGRSRPSSRSGGSSQKLF